MPRLYSARTWAWWTLFTLATLWMIQPEWQFLLRYDRVAIQDGQWWRLLSGHAVHGGFAHWLLNALGLALLLLLFRSGSAVRELLWPALLLGTVLGLVLYQAHPQLEHYLGFSGVLHGLFAYHVLRGLVRSVPDAWVAGVALLGKLSYEQWMAASPGTAAMIGMPVVIEAHLYGALAGAALAVLVDTPRVGRIAQKFRTGV